MRLNKPLNGDDRLAGWAVFVLLDVLLNLIQVPVHLEVPSPAPVSLIELFKDYHTTVDPSY